MNPALSILIQRWKSDVPSADENNAHVSNALSIRQFPLLKLHDAREHIVDNLCG